jgi:ArsR family transcriptional regulator
MYDDGDRFVCDVTFVDEENVKMVRQIMKPDRTLDRVAETFAVLGDPTRVKIVFALSQKELCVCDLAGLLGLTEPAVSHHLRLLRNLRLVKYRREGKMVYYSLDDDHIEQLLVMGLEHVEEQ